MIVKLSGRLIEKLENSLILDVNGLAYEVMMPRSILSRVDTQLGGERQLNLVTYHYIQISPSSGIPVLIGFFNEVERDFFQQFIKVSGIGPRAAVKALNRPISEISRAIADGDYKYLKTLPGIGLQKAKEIVAKLQSRVGKYGLIQDRSAQAHPPVEVTPAADWQVEALDVLSQLQYKRKEAAEMIQKAMERSPGIQSAEDLLNEIYKQRIGR